ncbi:MAG: substrate-binding domain-containing protein [Kiritimatiellae bacterium]|nr:substrate-binding domain-containing protein [Kiritimatiellia bacterium]
MQARRKTVVAIISTDYASVRAELRGVTDAAHRLDWSLETIDIYFQGQDYAKYGDLLSRADGVIARHIDAFADGTLSALGVPLVALDVMKANCLWASVACDDRAVAKAAAGELLATGRRAFAVVPILKPQTWTRPREQAFIDCIQEAGCIARRYVPKTDWDWDAERRLLSRWLARLPRPFGVFAPNDRMAKFTLEACLAAGLQVPRDAAIVGADDDDTYCLSVRPHLSSVRIDFEGAGLLAAETLSRLMEERERTGGRQSGRDMARPFRKPSRVERLHYGVLGVVRRASTRVDAAPLCDPRLQEGLDFIEAHSSYPYLGAGDVARAMHVGRRQADRLFAATGMTIQKHVEETRLARVRDLLATTDIPVGEIAAKCGFTSETYFSRLCRRRLGMAPSAWRKANAI